MGGYVTRLDETENATDNVSDVKVEERDTMRSHPFDELAKALAEGMSRRQALQRFGVGLGSALLVSLSPKAWADPASTCLGFCLGRYNPLLQKFKLTRCLFSCADCLQSHGTLCSAASTGAVICCAPGVTCTHGSCVTPSACGTGQAACGTGKCCPATLEHPDGGGPRPAFCASTQPGACFEKCCPQDTLCCAEPGGAGCYWPAGGCCSDSLGGACFAENSRCAIGRNSVSGQLERFCCDPNANVNFNDPDAVAASPDCTGGGPGRVSASPAFTV